MSFGFFKVESGDCVFGILVVQRGVCSTERGDVSYKLAMMKEGEAK